MRPGKACVLLKEHWEGNILCVEKLPAHGIKSSHREPEHSSGDQAYLHFAYLHLFRNELSSGLSLFESSQKPPGRAFPLIALLLFVVFSNLAYLHQDEDYFCFCTYTLEYERVPKYCTDISCACNKICMWSGVGSPVKILGECYTKEILQFFRSNPINKSILKLITVRMVGLRTCTSENTLTGNNIFRRVNWKWARAESMGHEYSRHLNY